MQILRRFACVGAAFLTLATVTTATAQQKDDKDAKDPRDPRDNDKRPKISLKAQPTISMAPSRVVLTAELQGGADDFEEYYCPSVEWQWGDGTSSEASSDCEPYEPGKSQIKRRFTVEHVFRAGNYRIMFHLKRRDKTVASATATIQVRPGLRDNGQ
jgi:hypothetical protein